MQVEADRRSRRVEAAPEAESAARAAQREIARAEVKAAEALVTIDERRAYVRSGFASVHAWAAAAGYGPQQAGRLLALGRALREAPELAKPVRRGTVPAESAIAVGRVLREPALDLTPEQRQEWIRMASVVPPRELRREVDRVIEEARQGRPTVMLRLHVTASARDGFQRARLLMSKGLPRRITEGMAFGRLVAEWLLRNDPRQRPLPKRRSGPTAGRPGRYVPRRVRAQVERRSGGMCEVCGERRATHKIHLRVPHAEGGSREVDNLADACSDCHLMVDAGVFAFVGFDQDGTPQWRTDGFPFDRDAGAEQPTEVRERGPPYARAACA